MMLGKQQGTIVVISLLVAALGLHAQTHQGVELVKARLIADSETVVPGQPITIGLHLKMAPGWHTYWEYPGDAGFPTSLDLKLPEGFRATAIQWPLPRRLVEPGDLEVYSYKDEVLLLMRLFPSPDLEGSEVLISGSSAWLVCEAICLPGRADVSLELAVGNALVPANQEIFQRFQEQLPQPLHGREGEPVRVNWERDGQNLFLEVKGPGEWIYDFYPLPPDRVVLGQPETLVSSQNEGAVIRVPLRSGPPNLTRLPGVLVAEEASGERRSWRVPAR